MTLIPFQSFVNLTMVLSYLGSALQRESVSWFSGVKITFRSYRSPQPRYQGLVMQLERVFRDADVNIIFRSLSSSATKMLNILTLNRKRSYRKRLRLAEYQKIRAPIQLPSQGIRRFSTKMRERLVCSLSVLVNFSIADYGNLLRRRF